MSSQQQGWIELVEQQTVREPYEDQTDMLLNKLVVLLAVSKPFPAENICWLTRWEDHDIPCCLSQHHQYFCVSS